MSEPAKPSLGINTLVSHPMFGPGRVLGYDGECYAVIFKGGDVKRVAFSFDAMTATVSAGDPQLDAIRVAVREVLGENGWIDTDLEMGRRWVGGTMKLIPVAPKPRAEVLPMFPVRSVTYLPGCS